MIHRTALFWGVLVASAGIVMLAGAMNASVEGFIFDVLRFWPLAVIALGVGLLLRRTPLALAGILVAAIVPGLMLGGVVVASPDWAMVCDEPDRGPAVVQSGTFSGEATIELRLACGDLTVRTSPGSGWRLDVMDLGDRTARVGATGDRLVVASPETRRGFDWGRGADDWDLALPTGVPLDIDARLAAGQGRFDLAGADIGTLGIEVNAGSARVDLSSATVDRIDLAVHAGSASVRLPSSGVFSGQLEAAAGSLELCRPEGLALRIEGDAVLGSTTFTGLVRVGDAWQTPDYSTAAARADLAVSATAGSVTVDPQGGCK